MGDFWRYIVKRINLFTFSEEHIRKNTLNFATKFLNVSVFLLINQIVGILKLLGVTRFEPKSGAWNLQTILKSINSFGLNST